jgi:hypothetical protein
LHFLSPIGDSDMRKPTNHRSTYLTFWAGVSSTLLCSFAVAAPINVTATILADNGSLAVLEQTPGSFSVIANSVSGQWPTPKTFTFQIDNDARAMRECKVHVIAWGDGSVAQGMMAHFAGDAGSVYTGQAGGPFTVAMSSITHNGGTAAGQAFANNTANAGSIISSLGAPANGFVSQAAAIGGIPGTWGPVNLPDVPGRGDIKFLWNTSSNALNANPNNYRVISTPCSRMVRPAPPPKPLDHIASWEIAGQFNSSNATASSSNPFSSQFEVWTYGYTVNPDCSGPLIPFTNRTSGPFVGTRQDLLSKGPNASNSSDLPHIGQSLDATAVTPLRYSPSGLTMHPGPSNECAVVRFTAPQAGRYRWMGRFWAQNTTAGGTNSGTKVVVKSMPSHPANDPLVNVFGDAATGTPSNNPFASPASGVNLAQGETIDFMVSSNGSFSNDSTGLHGYIQRDE